MENKESLINKRKEFEKKVQDKKKTEKSKYKLDSYDDIHYAIVNEINNDILSNLYKSLNSRVERIRNYFGERFNENRLEEMPGEHLDVLDSIIDGDAEKAQKLMSKHLKNALNYIVQLALYK
jgi:DNA-binding GntR family transcriptional regulator